MILSRILIAFSAVLILGTPGSGLAAEYPPEAAFMTQWGTIHKRSYESWGVATIPRYGANQSQKYGRHWEVWVDVPGFKFGDRVALWAAVKPIALKSGWTIVSENQSGGTLIVLHYEQNGVEAWANAGPDNQATQFELE